jgi:hypothetical protein
LTTLALRTRCTSHGFVAGVRAFSGFGASFNPQPEARITLREAIEPEAALAPRFFRIPIPIRIPIPNRNRNRNRNRTCSCSRNSGLPSAEALTDTGSPADSEHFANAYQTA